jgi:hypothetical protein
MAWHGMAWHGMAWFFFNFLSNLSKLRRKSLGSYYSFQVNKNRRHSSYMTDYFNTLFLHIICEEMDRFNNIFSEIFKNDS